MYPQIGTYRGLLKMNPEHSSAFPMVIYTGAHLINAKQTFADLLFRIPSIFYRNKVRYDVWVLRLFYASCSWPTVATSLAKYPALGSGIEGVGMACGPHSPLSRKLEEGAVVLMVFPWIHLHSKVISNITSIFGIPKVYQALGLKLIS